MNVYCLKQFKTEVEKLRRKNSYANVEADIIDHFINKSIADVQNGVRLNGSSENPYIKKRLEGRGGFRAYFLLIVKNNSIYLMYIHPKTGPYGADNIGDDVKRSLYKSVIEAIENNDLFEVSANLKNDGLIFKYCN